MAGKKGRSGRRAMKSEDRKSASIRFSVRPSLHRSFKELAAKITKAEKRQANPVTMTELLTDAIWKMLTTGRRIP